MTPAGARCEDGSALVIVLAFVAFVGVVSMAVLDFASTSFRLSSTTRDIEERTAAVDGAAKFALASLIEDPGFCKRDIEGAPTTNDVTPKVTCRKVEGVTARTDGTGWALYLDDAGGQVKADPKPSRSVLLSGPIYNGSTNSPWSIPQGSRLRVEDGAVLQRITAGRCKSPPRLLRASSSPFTCTPPAKQPDAPTPTQMLPSTPDLLPRRDITGVRTTVNCRVFAPGRYALPPVLAAKNYFMSGVYFFEQGIGKVSGIDLLAGGRPPTETSVLGLSSRVPCAIAESTGVQFIMGGLGSPRVGLNVGPNGRVEIHSMARADTTGTSIYVLRSTDAPPWGKFASTHGLADAPILQAGTDDRRSDLIVHGLVYAPGARISLAARDGGRAQILGGAVAGSVVLRSRSSARAAVAISAGELFPATQYVLTASVPGEEKLRGKAVTVTAVVRLPEDDPTHPVIYSWVVS